MIRWFRVVPRIPLIEDMTTGPVPVGSQILVEFDAASQWYNATFTIAAGWIRTGGKLGYYTFAHSPEDVRSRLNRLGINTEELEKRDVLQIWDWYTPALGLHSNERYTIESLKVADLSIHVSRVRMRGPQDPDLLVIADDLSVLGRFNDEKAWVEYELARSIPAFRMRKVTAIRGVVSELHSNLVYKRLESANEGIVDFQLETHGEETLNRIRVRTMRNIGFDSRWHALKISDENFEIGLA